MQIEQTAGDDLLTLTGDVVPADLPALTAALLAAVEGISAGSDLLVDAHGVTAFDDAALPAVVAARSRAKWNRMSVAALCDGGSPLEAALRRSGHLGRIGVHPDAATARRTLAGRRAARAGRLVASGGPADAAPASVDRGAGPHGTANPYRVVS